MRKNSNPRSAHSIVTCLMSSSVHVCVCVCVFRIGGRWAERLTSRLVRRAGLFPYDFFAGVFVLGLLQAPIPGGHLARVSLGTVIRILEASTASNFLRALFYFRASDCGASNLRVKTKRAPSGMPGATAKIVWC